MAKRKKNPLTVRCPICDSMPGFSCTEKGWPLVIPHDDRYARLLATQPPLKEPATKPLAVKCPHCKAMPLRPCVGPPPFRDPRPIHKARWLAAEKVDQAVRKARGLDKRESLAEKPREKRPWLAEGNTAHPAVVVLTPEEVEMIRRLRSKTDGE